MNTQIIKQESDATVDIMPWKEMLKEVSDTLYQMIISQSPYYKNNSQNAVKQMSVTDVARLVNSFEKIIAILDKLERAGQENIAEDSPTDVSVEDKMIIDMYVSRVIAERSLNA